MSEKKVNVIIVESKVLEKPKFILASSKCKDHHPNTNARKLVRSVAAFSAISKIFSEDICIE